jgi:prepilin-type processing-associated H-X9-DG protein
MDIVAMNIPASRLSPSLRSLALTVVGVSAVWLAGCGGGGGGTSNGQYQLSITRLKAANLGVIMYMEDYDDTLPLSFRWMDEVLPYTKNETDFHSPAIGATGYGYAMNTQIAGQTLPQFPNPSVVVSVFDSTDLSRNATDGTGTEPTPPRYGGHNTIGFLDGHVQDENTVGNPPPTLYQQSQTRLKQVDLGMLMYANDYDEALPLKGQWADEMLPYTKSDLVFHSPLVELQNPSNYGYALNSVVAGQLLPSFSIPSSTISFFDSTVLTKNATTPTSTMPSPPRYGAANTIAYLDGHVHP